jgi:hypothetical protein
MKVYEYKDLSKPVRERIFEEFLNEQVEADLNTLYEDKNAGLITEDQLYKIIGCSKYYAEVTAWFVPSCYYKHNKKQVDADIKDTLSRALFNAGGTFIEYKEATI